MHESDNGDEHKTTFLRSPNELCFNSHCFQKDNFQVDKFVAESKNKVSFRVFREDLEAHYKNIRISLIDLINNDYSDFVNLSSNLVGMEKHIHDLKYPLGQLHKEIQAIKGKLNKELEIIENKLAHRRKAKEKKTHLQHLLNATTYVEKIEKILFSDHHSKDMAIFLDNKESVGQFLERVAGDFNQLQFHVNQSKGHPIVSLIRPRVSLITSKLQESLETSFQQGLASFQSDLVLRCLRTYALIDKTDHAEDLFRHNFVREKLKTLITQDCYESNGLESVCNSVIGFIKADCDLILTLTSKAANASHQKECGIKGFNFLANAIWPEIDFAFENRLSFIFSPGNPSLFFQRFKIMMKLLESFEVICGSTENIKELREQKCYQNFMAKWSLPVYFQIRLQEIICCIETVMDASMEVLNEPGVFSTNVIDIIWKCMEACWDDDIFIKPLISRFWKLFLQINKRLSTFLKDVMKDGNLSEDNQIPARQKYDVFFYGHLLGDINNLATQARFLFENKVKLILIEISENGIYQYEDAFNDCLDSLKQCSCEISNYCVLYLTEVCTQHLEKTKNIPRLYRRTNKEQPLQESRFITAAFSPLKDFCASSKNSITSDVLDVIMERSISTALERYYVIVHELVTSIKKTEESLQRLKRLRKGGDSNLLTISSNDISDESKIRKQLHIDINKFGEEAQNLTKQPLHLKEEYNKLLELL